RGKLYITKKTIQIGANKKTVRRYKDVYGIFLGGFDIEENYEKLLSNFNKEEVKEYYKNIVEDIVNYININKGETTNDYCYWITGYSIAGGIAAEVAKELKKDSEVYCYTFGATNTNTEGSGANSYIKNIINEDDLYPKIYNKDEGFMRSGNLYNDSIYDNLTKEYKKLIGKKYNNNENRDSISPKVSNTIAKTINEVRKDIKMEGMVYTWERDLSKYLKTPQDLEKQMLELPYIKEAIISTKLTTLLNKYKNGVKKAHDMKSYYVLAKSLNGFDLNNKDIGWSDVEEVIESEEVIEDLTKEEEEYQKKLDLLIKSIETVGKAYLKNVYTYHGADKAAYSGEKSIENRIAEKLKDQNTETYDVIDTIFNEKKRMKTSTVEAYGKWNDRKEEVYNKIYQNVKNNVIGSEEEMTDEKQEEINSLTKGMMKGMFTQMKAADENSTAIHHLEILDEYANPKNIHKRYNYNDTIDFGMINKENHVGDDCSCFATAVYWYYLNQLEEANGLDKIDLWTTGSSKYISKSKETNKPNILDILINNDFEVYQWDSNPKSKV
ncbi:MAG: hypothetical protein IKP66_10135, partial [Lachnospiraceae bacterium]|nr:hypothetical protein [Lachnospiraceae bacterium]